MYDIGLASASRLRRGAGAADANARHLRARAPQCGERARPAARELVGHHLADVVARLRILGPGIAQAHDERRHGRPPRCDASTCRPCHERAKSTTPGSPHRGKPGAHAEKPLLGVGFFGAALGLGASSPSVSCASSSSSAAARGTVIDTTVDSGSVTSSEPAGSVDVASGDLARPRPGPRSRPRTTRECGSPPPGRTATCAR